MKKIIIATLSLMLTNCAGGNVAQSIKLGKKCTIANSNQIQESSFIWFVSKEALEDFDARINKKHCLDS